MIIGAGLAGLIAAHAWPKELIVEAGAAPLEQHKALLRFRSTAVSDLTGIEFKPVTVRKAIFSNNQFVAPNPMASNLYARKVVDRVVDRSIWNLDTVTRYIAPEDFYLRLIEAVGSRIAWGQKADFSKTDFGHEPIISTAPLPIVLDGAGISHDLEFERAPITVQRFRVENADVYQTIYFPDPTTSLYRASMTGDMLICEYNKNPTDHDESIAIVAMGLDLCEIEPLGTVEQRYGKIVDVNDQERKALLSRLTNDHNIFSLGRFATWRNVLLDDVVHDVAVIKRLMTAQAYDAKLIRG